MMSDQQLDDEPMAMAHIVAPTHDAWGDILRPVTIFQVLQAESSENNSLIIEGKTFAAVSTFKLWILVVDSIFEQVTLVAHVASVEINPAKASYILEDGTGRICGDKELSSLVHRHGLSAEAEEEEITQCKAL